MSFPTTLAGELHRILARAFANAGLGRSHANLAALLASPLAAGLAIDDPAEAAETLLACGRTC